jgi:alpha-aminoadipate carrier protein LysW
VPFGTLRAQVVTNKSQCLKETRVNLRDISHNKKRGNKMIKPIANLKTQEVKAINKAKCPDCDAELDVPADTVKGEILSCPGCGLELEVKQVKAGCVDLQELTIEGEDWGE